ncbi:hypothetical protein EVAR_44193_1 [Eumeta japonica]|uniref:Uncharacterized protein n=1 Tax=Eumeta variegata TaxID=151549 RepID=A0A4C1W3K6_EUMVA|nr:hypothetical protein EVAR_44193_1 [Eumeta japonica]
MSYKNRYGGFIRRHDVEWAQLLSLLDLGRSRTSSRGWRRGRARRRAAVGGRRIDRPRAADEPPAPRAATHRLIVTLPISFRHHREL